MPSTTSPFAMFDFSKLILPYFGSAFAIVLAVSAVFVTITTAVLLYHWWRYSDSIILTTITVGSYLAGSVILLLIMWVTL